MRQILGLLLVCLSLASGPKVRAADPPGAATKTASYTATGPTGEADLARLQTTLARLPGVQDAQVRPAPGGAVVRIRGEHLVSVFSAAARTLGFVLRPAPTRFFAAAGPATEVDLKRLQEALTRIEGIDRVDTGNEAPAVAVRVTGVVAPPVLVAAGKGAGFTLRQIGSYVVAGPTATGELARLRRLLREVAGVEQVDMQGLSGGATLLVYGDVNDAQLAKAAEAVGFALWPLGSAPGPLKFRISEQAGGANTAKLRQSLQAVEGIGALEVRAETEGPCLIVNGGRARPEAIVASGKEAGFTLLPVEVVSLPSLVPAAGRNTPPDYDERVLEEQAKLGGPAPDFALRGKDGPGTLTLSQFRGKKPVVLMFGSCT